MVYAVWCYSKDSGVTETLNVYLVLLLLNVLAVEDVKNVIKVFRFDISSGKHIKRNFSSFRHSHARLWKEKVSPIRLSLLWTMLISSMR